MFFSPREWPGRESTQDAHSLCQDWAICNWGKTRRNAACARKREVTHFRRRLSWTTHSTLSQRQFPQGNCSTTSHRTLRALHDAHARGARRLVTLLALSALSFVSAIEPVRFLACASGTDGDFFAFVVVSFTSTRLSAGPSPGVDTDSEREWNPASLFAIVYVWVAFSFVVE